MNELLTRARARRKTPLTPRTPLDGPQRSTSMTEHNLIAAALVLLEPGNIGEIAKRLHRAGKLELDEPLIDTLAALLTLLKVYRKHGDTNDVR